MPLPGLLVGIAAGQQVKQQAHRGAGLIRAAVLAVEAVRQDQSLQLVGFEAAVEKVAERSGQKTDQSARVVARQATEAAKETPEFSDLAEATRVHVRGRFQEKRLQVRGEPHEFRFGLGEAFDVGRRHAPEFTAHASFVRPPADDIAVFESGLHAGITGDHFQTIGAELQVADDRRSQHAGDIRCRGDAAARREFGVDFLCDGAAADDIAAFEHEDAPAGAREVCRTGQAVVSGPDDDDVVLHTNTNAASLRILRNLRKAHRASSNPR